MKDYEVKTLNLLPNKSRRKTEYTIEEKQDLVLAAEYIEDDSLVELVSIDDDFTFITIATNDNKAIEMEISGFLYLVSKEAFEQYIEENPDEDIPAIYLKDYVGNIDLAVLEEDNNGNKRYLSKDELDSIYGRFMRHALDGQPFYNRDAYYEFIIILDTTFDNLEIKELMF